MSQPAKLPRVMGLRDLVLLHIVAIIGLRWLLTASSIGSSSIILWLLAVLLFFIPQGLAVLELSSRLPEEGGIYVWTREAFGPLHGFICGWAYWVNNLIYYPSLIVFTAGNAVFILGRQYAGLADNALYQLIFALCVLWLALGLNIIGLRTGRWVQNTGATANWLVVVMIIILGAAAWSLGVGRNPLTVGELLPRLGHENIGLWSSLCFALAGLELAVIMGGEVRDPERTLPRSILIAAPLIAGTYIICTLAVMATFPDSGVDIVTGVVEAVAHAGDLLGVSLSRLAGLLLVLTGLGGIGAWLAGSARIPFVIGIDRYLPPVLGRVHPRWQTPHVALIVQGVGATVFILLGALGSSVEEAYLVLVDTTLIVYFIPYLYLFLSLAVLRRRNVSSGGRVFAIPGGMGVVYLVAIAGFATTAVSIILATIPTEIATSPLWFVLKVIGGAVGLLVVGLLFYFKSTRQTG
ncbi:MAG: amino acid permease [Fidelibacterota bacterium]|nr:MAG: amino acid permease [Candidatus Neomarinimicrobiota bacterium]